MSIRERKRDIGRESQRERERERERGRERERETTPGWHVVSRAHLLSIFARSM